MRFESYIPFDELKEGEFIITYQCFVDAINNRQVDNYMDVSYEVFDKIFNIETKGGGCFNVIIPCDVFNFEDYKINSIREFEQIGNNKDEVAELERKFHAGECDEE